MYFPIFLRFDIISYLFCFRISFAYYYLFFKKLPCYIYFPSIQILRNVVKNYNNHILMFKLFQNKLNRYYHIIIIMNLSHRVNIFNFGLRTNFHSHLLSFRSFA